MSEDSGRIMAGVTRNRSRVPPANGQEPLPHPGVPRNESKPSGHRERWPKKCQVQGNQRFEPMQPIWPPGCLSSLSNGLRHWE